MKLETKALKQAMKVLKKVAPAKGARPILSNIALFADDKAGIIVEATDLETTVRVRLEAEGKAGFLCPAKLLDKALGKANGSIAIDITPDGKVAIDTGKVRLTAGTEDIKDFPETDKAAETGFTVRADVLRSILERGSLYASKEAKRCAIRGIYFGSSSGACVIVATDGKRLYRSRALPACDPALDYLTVYPKSEGRADKRRPFPDHILSTASAKVFLAILGEVEDDTDVRIGFLPEWLTMEVGKWKAVARSMEEQFPAWDAVMPASSEQGWRINAKEVREALDNVGILGDLTAKEKERSGNYRAACFLEWMDDEGAGESHLIYHLRDETASATIATSWQGEAETRVLAIGFDRALLADQFAFVEEDALLQVKDAFSPVMVEGPDGDAFVLMPLTLPKPKTKEGEEA